MEPASGTSYPVELGASFLGAAQEEFYALRYDFKPASVSDVGRGEMEIQAGTQRVSLALPSTSGSAPVQFQGCSEPSRDGLDCVAIFDGTSFRLERLTSSVRNLRHVPSVQRGAAPQPRKAPPPLAALPLQPEATQPSSQHLTADLECELEADLEGELEGELLSELTREPEAPEAALPCAPAAPAPAVVAARPNSPVVAAAAPAVVAARPVAPVAAAVAASAALPSAQAAAHQASVPAAAAEALPTVQQAQAPKPPAPPPVPRASMNDLELAFFGAMDAESSGEEEEEEEEGDEPGGAGAGPPEAAQQDAEEEEFI